MADKTTPPEGEAASATPAKPSRSYTTALMIGVGLVTGGAFGTFFSGPMVAKSAVTTTHSLAGESQAAGGHGAPEAGHDASALPAVVLVDNLVLNPAGSAGLRFLLISVGLQLSSAAATETVKARDTEVRDAIMAILGKKGVEDLTNTANHVGMKREIKVAIDSLLAGDAVTAVYFPQFVIQ